VFNENSKFFGASRVNSKNTNKTKASKSSGNTAAKESKKDKDKQEAITSGLRGILSITAKGQSRGKK